MAPKRPSPLEEPPAASSTSEEEESEEEEEGESEEESEEEPAQQHHKKTSSPPPPTPPVDKKSSSSSSALKKTDSQPQFSSSDDGSDTGSGSESESDSDVPHRPSTTVPDPNVKPIASKPMDEASKLKKPRSKPAAQSSATPTKTVSKRPIEKSEDGKESKRAKKKVADADGGDVDGEEKKSGEDSKKQLFQRLWSEDDEIAILKGMFEFSSKKGVDPSTDMNAFHDFIKKSLHVDVTRTQLVDKVRRLKKKYENNLGKGKKGEDRTFSKPHEQKAYELSKKVWGGEANNGGVDNSKSNGKAGRSQKGNKRLTPVEKEQLLSSLRSPKETPKKEVEQNSGSGPSRCASESIRFSKSVGVTGLDEDIIKEGLELIGGSKRSELEEKWRKLQMAEMELFLRRVELVREQTKLVLDAYKASEH